jgi:hypothetical protein
MNNNPSAQSIGNATEVLELASLLDHRVPTPDKARILAWARQIDRYNLNRDDMLDACQSFYDRPSPQPVSVGDIIETSRRIKRDRLDREADEERDTRRVTVDTKAADEIRSIAAGFIAGPVKSRTDRLAKAEIALQCCNGKRESQSAIRDYFAARIDARSQAKA